MKTEQEKMIDALYILIQFAIKMKSHKCRKVRVEADAVLNKWDEARK